MKITLAEKAQELREQFIKKHVLSWESFQIEQKDRIAQMAKTAYPVHEEW